MRISSNSPDRHAGHTQHGATTVGATDARRDAEGGIAMHWHPGWTTAADPMLSSRHGARTRAAVDHYVQALEALAARPDAALSLAVKVPFCAAQCLFCDRVIHAAQPAEAIDDYVGGLVDEVRALAARAGRGHDLAQVHLGGGSANELNASQLARLIEALQHAWRLPADAELSADCDPRRVSWLQLKLLADFGFRRITFGVPDLDLGVQEAAGRVQSPQLVDDVCELARSAGIEYINLDLMVGLPHQTTAQWHTTLRRLIALAPDRVRLTHYRHQPQRVLAHRSIDAESLPAPAACRALAAQTAQQLREAGYRWIGGDQFVLDTDELALAHDQGTLRRSLISYTATPPTALLGLGVGAVGEVDGHVYWNEALLPVWRDAVGAHCVAVSHVQPADAHDALRRDAVQHLLCRLELPASAVRGGLEAAYARLAAHEARGLVRVLDDRIVLTDAGRLELPALCAELARVDAPPSHQAPGATPGWLS